MALCTHHSVNVNEINARVRCFSRIEFIREKIQPSIRHFDDADIGFQLPARSRTRRGFPPREHIEYGGLACRRQPDDSRFHLANPLSAVIRPPLRLDPRFCVTPPLKHNRWRHLTAENLPRKLANFSFDSLKAPEKSEVAKRG